MPDVFKALCAAVTEAVQDLIVQDVGNVLLSRGDAGLNMPDVFEALYAAVTVTVQDLNVQDVGHVL